VAGSWDGDPKADLGSAGRQPAVAGSVPATMISLTDLVSEAFRPAARNTGLRPVRQGDILSAFGSAAAERNSAGRTDLAVYVPNLVYRADL